MIIMEKGQFNELTMNVNNNSRQEFDFYNLEFTHIVSQEIKVYTIYTSGTSYFENIRYCQFDLNLATDDLNYEGQYQLKIYGDGTDLVFVGMALLDGTVEGQPFTQFISSNEDNSNYIFLS